MTESHAADPAGALSLRQTVLWGVFAVLLVLGVVLWFRFSSRITPMLDLFTDR